MGSITSVIDCKKCYSTASKQCVKEVSVNSDIAGIGILISFFLSALLLGGVIIWGYWMESLPSGLLTPADHYVVTMLKKRSLRFGDPTALLTASHEQIRRRRTVTGYTKVLGDQQLITGLATIIAALANRRDITLYEFRIVTSLAYFAAFTHLCSLYILQEYMHRHTRARSWHLAFTIGFLPLLCLAFIVDGAITSFDSREMTYLNPGNTFQCFFELSSHHKTVDVTPQNYLPIIGGFVAHIRVLGNLFAVPSSSVTTRLLYRTIIPRLRKLRLSSQECDTVLNNARKKYWEWLQPLSIGRQKQTVSFWYIIETYHSSGLSFLPTMLAFFAYGTSRVIFSLLPAGFKLSDDIFILGFGQVVAIGLLALTLLSMIEIYNEEAAQDADTFASKPTASSQDSDDLQPGEQANVWEDHGAELDVITSEGTPTKVDNIDIGVVAHSNVVQESANNAIHRPTISNAKPISSHMTASLPQNARKRRHRHLEWLVRLWIPKSTEELDQIKQGHYFPRTDTPYVAARLAIGCSVMSFVHAATLIWAGVAWNVGFNHPDLNAMGFFGFAAAIVWLSYRTLQTGKRVLGLVYFVLEDIELMQAKVAGNAALGGSTRGSSSDALLMGSSQGSAGRRGRRDSGARREGGEGGFVLPPIRRDIEDGVGLMPLVKQQNYPQLR